MIQELFETASVWLPGVVAMLVLTITSGFFSGSETALFYLSREDLRRMQTGTPAERLAATLMRNPDRLLTVVLFWNLVINLVYFAVSLVLAKRLVDGGHASLAGLLSLLGLLGIIIFGEVAPKSLAVIFRRPVAVWASWPLSFAVRILDPILPWLGATTRGLRRALWPDLKHEPYLEVEDIERAIENSELGVEVLRLEQQILGRILDISDITAEELMRPRGTYTAWQIPVHLEQIRRPIEEQDDFLFIADDDGDTIIKAIALRELSHLPKEHLEKVADSVVYVPWCGSIADTLSSLRRGLVSVAAVVNEYGETVGVVTEDDILDTLFDPTSSRTERLLERNPIVKTKRGYRVDGLVTLRFLAERLGFDFDPSEDGVLTVAALLHDVLERFPEVGDICEWHGFQFKVTRAETRGGELQVTVSRLENPPATT